MIRAENIHFSYGDRKILNGIHLELRSGELTTILGRNGEGKSTLFRLLTGELQPGIGSVQINGKCIKTMDWKELARVRSVLPQESQVTFPLTNYEVVELGRSPHPKDIHSDRHAVRRSMELTDTWQLRDRFFYQLSGGEKKRVQIARVLCQLETSQDSHGKGILFLDEPVNALDILLQHRVMEILRHLADVGYTVFLVLHDWNLAGLYSDRILILKEGVVLGDGKPDEVLTPSALAENFLVRTRIFPEGGGRVSGYSHASLDPRFGKENYTVLHS